jgi:hypothetical protein
LVVALVVGAQPEQEVAGGLAAVLGLITVLAEHQQQIKALTAATPMVLKLAAAAAVREAQVFLVYPALISQVATVVRVFYLQ